MMVTCAFACWNPEIQAVSAAPCADEPMPLRVPESLLTGAAEPEVLGAASFAAHEDRRMVPATAMAAMLLTRAKIRRLTITEFPSGDCSIAGGAGADPSARLGT